MSGSKDRLLARSGAQCLPVDCGVRDLTVKKTQRVGPVQNEHHHNVIKKSIVLAIYRGKITHLMLDVVLTNFCQTSSQNHTDRLVLVFL